MKSKNIIILIVILAAALTATLFVINKTKTNDPHAGHDDHPANVEGDEAPGHDEHEEGDEDPDHADHDHEEAIALTAQQIKDIGIKLETAQKGSIETFVNLPGEVAVNSDRMAHIVPRVPGVVLEAKKKLGDPVKAGEVMAVI